MQRREFEPYREDKGLTRYSSTHTSTAMGIQITIGDVSEEVRDELASPAVLQGKSMQEYLCAELERLSGRPSMKTWLERVRKKRKRV